jgi:hypothetical protein
VLIKKIGAITNLDLGFSLATRFVADGSITPMKGKITMSSATCQLESIGKGGLLRDRDVIFRTIVVMESGGRMPECVRWLVRVFKWRVIQACNMTMFGVWRRRRRNSTRGDTTYLLADGAPSLGTA